MEDVNQQTADLSQMNRFPPTVVSHDEYEDGYDLQLLDPGTEEEPRFIRLVDGENPVFVGGGQ